jgi:hypothetical protein
VESGNATRRYLTQAENKLLGDHMLERYQTWLSEYPAARFLQAKELFLVTSTTMTCSNWVATAFHKVPHMISAEGRLAINATLAQRKVAVDWDTESTCQYGYQLGHTHQGRQYPRYNGEQPFAAACNTCPDPQENQCLFLRGWRVHTRTSLPLGLRPTAYVKTTEGEKRTAKTESRFLGRAASAFKTMGRGTRNSAGQQSHVRPFSS